MKNLLLLCALFMMSAVCVQAQSLEELKAMKTEKEGVKKNIDQEIADLDKKIREYPGWTTGLGVLFGLDFAGANKWYGISNPNNRSQNFSIGLGAFANLNQDKYYWRNGLSAQWANGNVVISELLDPGRDSTENSIEVGDISLTSTGGYYLYENLIAVSARANWTSFLFDFTPGSITFSAGVSITPMKDLEFWIHPLGYQLNYPGDDFTSTPGASFGGSYTGNLYRNIKWTSELAGFFSYQGDEDNGLEASDLHNWTWKNGFIIDNLWNGIGVGANIGIRQNKQLARFAGISDVDSIGDLQTFYNVGFTYNIAR